MSFGDGGVGKAPTMLPTISPMPTVSQMPTVYVPPTPRPTPSGEFSYRAEGDSNFGFKYQDTYSLGHQHAFRRPGWSYSDITSGPAPFCYGSVCYDVEDVCDRFDGILLHPSVCSFPEDVKIAGVSCWRGSCIAQGGGVCGAVGGMLVGVRDGVAGPQWCVFRGGQSLIGPMCYGTKCFSTEAQTACSAVKGRIWNDNFCIVGGHWTPVGPLCWNGNCIFGDSSLKCTGLGGTIFADRWCLVPGCDRTVVGPTCSLGQTNPQDQCFRQATNQFCRKLKGVNFGDRFCLLDGTEWTVIGPTVYERQEVIGPTSDFCRDIGHNLVGYFNLIESHEIAGRFCVAKQRIPTTAPFCADDGCNVTMGRNFCSRFGGKALNQGFMCSLCDSFRQVVGPLAWNGTTLQGDPKYCEGSFCAIPSRLEDLTSNLRCPTADPPINRCRQFGGVRGIPNFTNIGEDGDDDDDDDDDDGGGGTSTSNASRSGLSLWVISSSLWLLMQAAAWTKVW